MNCSPPGSSVHRISSQENWSGLPFPSPGHLPNPGIKPGSPALHADSLSSELQGMSVHKVVLKSQVPNLGLKHSTGMTGNTMCSEGVDVKSGDL